VLYSGYSLIQVALLSTIQAGKTKVTTDNGHDDVGSGGSALIGTNYLISSYI